MLEIILNTLLNIPLEILLEILLKISLKILLKTSLKRSGGIKMADKRQEYKVTIIKQSGEGKGEKDKECVVILFPGFEELKEEVKKLHIELSMLLLERDELKYVECKNIEMEYMLTFGALEYKVIELDCLMRRLKKKIQLIQAKKNRQEEVLIFVIEEMLDKEFAQYKEKLDEQMDKINEAIERNNSEVLSEEETRELKSLYRTIVKALHPDIHPDVSKEQLRLFQNAVEAYKRGDLKTLRLIKEMISEPMSLEPDENGMSVLIKEKERLLNMIRSVKEEMEKIKGSYPYQFKCILQNEERIAQRKEELEDIILRLQEMIETYKKRIEEMLG